MVSGGPVSSFQTLVSDVKKIITYPLSLHHKGYEEVERFMKSVLMKMEHYIATQLPRFI